MSKRTKISYISTYKILKVTDQSTSANEEIHSTNATNHNNNSLDKILTDIKTMAPVIAINRSNRLSSKPQSPLR